MSTIDKTSEVVAFKDAGRSSMKLDARQRWLRPGPEITQRDASGNERLNARRYRPGAVQCTSAMPSRRPMVAMIGKRSVAANLFAAIDTVSHVASPVNAG